MAVSIKQADIRVGRQGRMVIPVELRRSLKIKSGETLLARIEDDSLILESRDTVLKRMKNRFDEYGRANSLTRRS